MLMQNPILRKKKIYEAVETVCLTSGLDSQQVGSSGGHIPGLLGGWAPNVKHSTMNTEHGINGE